MAKPILFIGSASESLPIVNALADHLADCVEIERWDYDTFKPGKYLLESLGDQLQRSDFAAFVLGRDDRTISRGKSLPSPRDNVIFEAGLFTSGLGNLRTFFLVNSRGTKRPSDWDGLGYLVFHPERRSPRERVAEAAQAIRARVAEYGSKSARGALAAAHGDWWQFVMNEDYEAVLSHMTIDASSGTSISVRGHSWSNDGKMHSTYRSQSASFNPTLGTLYYSWEGEHPVTAAMVRYFGIGEIRFETSQNRSRSGQGFYSTTASDEPANTLVNQCLYLPMSQRENALLRSGAIKDLRALLNSKLQKRRQLRK